MANEVQYKIMKVRRKTAALMGVLLEGQIGLETDTNLVKIGTLSGNMTIADVAGSVYLLGQDQYVKTTSSVHFSKVQVGTNTPAQGADIWTGQNYVAEAGWHAFEDENTIENHGGHGYACFDAMATMKGTGPYNHFVGFQSRPIYTGSGNITNYFSAFDAFPVHSGLGTVAVLHGLHIRDAGGVGPITEDYGIYIDNIWRGTTNYAIYVAGGASWFGSGLKASLIQQNTANGADSAFLGIGGGGAANDVTRGGCINLFGNEHALGGAVAYLAGAGDGATYGDHIWYGGGGPSEFMRLDGNTGRLGIGQDTPLALIHVTDTTMPVVRVSYTTNSSAGGFATYNNGGEAGLLYMTGTTFAGGYGGASCLCLINTAGPISASPAALTTPTLFLSATYSYIHAGTADAADTSYLELAGGGAGAITRGGTINLFGNEHALKGSIAYIAGSGDGATYGDHIWYGNAGPTEIARLNKVGLFTLYSGAGAILCQSICRGTTDGADNSYLEFGGGGAASVTRGGAFNLFGNEHALKGAISFIAGNGDGVNYGSTLFYGGAGPTLLMTLLASGKLGINDAAPAEALDVTGNANLTGVLKIDDVQVMKEQQAAIADPTLGVVIDAECRAQLILLLGAMRAHGAIST